MTGAEIAVGRADPWAGVFDELDHLMLVSACRVTSGVLEQVRRLGGERRFVARLWAAGDLGLAQVSLSPDGSRWDFEGPDRRLLIAVRERGELRDVVACASHCRDEWALATGDGWALGLDRYAEAEARAVCQGKASLRLCATPFDWLAAGGAGICVLDWGASALAELRSLGPRVTLVADSPAAAERLKSALQHGGLPLVRSAGHQGRLAA